MKMTRQEVIDLLQNMNEDCSNVVEYIPITNKYQDVATHDNENQILIGIGMGRIYRIKDNSVKEVTLDLFDRVVVSKSGKQKGRISYVCLGTEDWNPHVVIGQDAYNLDDLNNDWQLMED